MIGHKVLETFSSKKQIKYQHKRVKNHLPTIPPHSHSIDDLPNDFRVNPFFLMMLGLRKGYMKQRGSAFFFKSRQILFFFIRLFGIIQVLLYCQSLFLLINCKNASYSIKMFVLENIFDRMSLPL